MITTDPTLIVQIDYLTPEQRQAHYMDVAGVVAGTNARWLPFNPETTHRGFQLDRIAIPRMEFADLYRRINDLSYGIRLSELYRV